MKSCILGLALTALLFSGTLPAQTPPLINYQGRIVVGGVNFDSTTAGHLGQFKFALVNAGVNLSTPATAVAIVNAGQVVSMAINAPGSGYTVAPIVTFNHPTGTGATAVATITNGSVTGLQITNGGSGYSSNPTIAIAPPPPNILTTRFWDNDGDGVGPANEPTDSVALLVTKGLYSALLGDTTIDNMAAIPAGVFTQPDLRLRVWFSDGTASGFQLLTPDQRLAPTAYLANGSVTEATVQDQAITTAKIAGDSIDASKVKTGAIGANQIAGGAINVSHFSVQPSQAEGGQVLGYNGTDITWMDPNSGVFSLNGTNAYYNGGNVGIGISTPASKLDVRGGLVLETGSNAAIFTGTGNNELNRYLHLGNSPTFATASGLKAGGILVANDYTYANPGKSRLVVQGDVGIGTPSPQTKLHVRDNVSVSHRIETTSPFANAWSLVEFANGNGQWNIGTSRSFFNDQFYFARAGFAPVFSIETNGNITASRLILRKNGDTSNVAILCGDASVTTFVPFNTATNRQLDIFVRDASVRQLTIRGGMDLAEPFEMKEEALEKGSVVVIDDEHPGRLKRSSRAYDARVAGIISGANGINPGIALHQEGLVEGGQNVALSGRVYVRAEADSAPVKPGDLLTTSDLPGHARKVTEHTRAQGAVLGKAMSSLPEGTGMVLVLVTLQ